MTVYSLLHENLNWLNKNWKFYWSEQSFTGLGPADWCSSWELCICTLSENIKCICTISKKEIKPLVSFLACFTASANKLYFYTDNVCILCYPTMSKVQINCQFFFKVGKSIHVFVFLILFFFPKVMLPLTTYRKYKLILIMM